jgi:2-polyprenyl-3-methyl-5-hydroxy-6-metoxy-1,4-benzoquinol methylase
MTTGGTELACNNCRSLDQEVIFPAGLAQVSRIVRCRGCGLMFASPRSSVDIDEIVQWDAEYVYKVTKEQDSDRVEKQVLQRRDYRDTLAFLAQRHPGRGQLVEVGSSLGYLLKYFEADGWDVTGVEPNAGHALFAQRELGIRTLSTSLGESGLGSACADAVLMMHVIEHVPDPVAMLEEIRGLLKPGGTFVMETPRYDSLSFKLLRHRERSVSCDGHIYFFTIPSLSRMAARCGFRILRTDCVGRSMTLSRLLYNVGVMSKAKSVTRTLGRASRRLRFNKVPLHLNARDMVRIYLTPA